MRVVMCLGMCKVILRYNHFTFVQRSTLIRFFLILFTPLLLLGGEIHLSLQSVSENGDSATAESGKIQRGVSGFIVRHFNEEHSAIIANAIVTEYDAGTKIATLSLSEYTGLRQNSLPTGRWQPHAGDEVVLAYGYDRGLLLAPNETIWRRLTSRISAINWIHPDNFATFLSFAGHPTPIKEDINSFCTLSNVGLLYIYAEKSLFTLDCQSLTLLQITAASFDYEQPELPFFSRVEEINEAWWGEGSSPIDAYEPYYFELMVENNPSSQKLYDYLKTLDSDHQELLEEFEIEENK